MMMLHHHRRCHTPPCMPLLREEFSKDQVRAPFGLKGSSWPQGHVRRERAITLARVLLPPRISAVLRLLPYPRRQLRVGMLSSSLPRPVVQSTAGRFAAAVALIHSPAGSKWLVRTHVITLADGYPVVAQDGISGGDMKEELRRSIVRQIGLTAQLLFLWRTGAQYDFPAFAALEL